MHILAESKKTKNQARSYFNKYFYRGIGVLGVAAFFEATALEYSPEMTVSALSGSAIVFNTLFKLLTKSAERETYQKTGYLVLRGALLVLVGVTIVLTFSSKVRGERKRERES